MAKPLINVAIIGAGISGIAAAKVLQKIQTVEFKIFEATDRLGGRIWTHYYEGTLLSPSNVVYFSMYNVYNGKSLDSRKKLLGLSVFFQFFERMR